MSKLTPKMANIITWVIISTTGVLTGGGIGGIVAYNKIQEKLAENEDDLEVEETDNSYMATYEKFVEENGLSGDVSTVLSVPDILNISFSKLEQVESYVCESNGLLDTLQKQYITSAKGRKGNYYFAESNSIAPNGIYKMEVGSRYVYEGDKVNSYECNKIYITDNNYVHSTYNNNVVKSYTNEEFTEYNGCDITDPNIYRISSKTCDNTEGKQPTIQKVGNEYHVTISLTKSACKDYIRQIINTSDGMVVGVTFEYSNWTMVLSEDLLPKTCTIEEKYTTKTSMLVSAKCLNTMNQKFYYGDSVSFPSPDQPYILREEV